VTEVLIGVALFAGAAIGVYFAHLPAYVRHRWRERHRAAPATALPRSLAEGPKVPEGLRRALETGRCVLVAGAGLSAQSKLPTWPELLGGIVADARARTPSATLDRLSGLHAAGRYDAVAEGVMQALGRDGVRTALRRILRGPQIPQPTPVYRELKGARFSAVITNHWDDQLHAALGGESLTSSRSADGSERMRRGERFVLKLFGELDGVDFRFTDDELLAALAEHHEFRQLVGGLISTRTLVFVGMSPEGIDRFCRAAGMRALAGAEPSHFALVPERPETEIETARMERRYGVLLLPFQPGDDYGPVPTFAAELARHGRRSRGVEATLERLRHVTLTNIGPFERLELDVPKDRLVLLGDNASGKTSVLRAIALALCGETPDTVIAPARLLRSGAASGSIELRFRGGEDDEGVAEHVYRTELRRQGDQVRVEADAVTPVQAGAWLAIGFPALRGASTTDPRGASVVPGRPPSPDDLLPLLGREVDTRVNDVKQWVFTQALARKRKVPDALDPFFDVLRALSPGVRFAYDDVVEATGEIRLSSPDGAINLDMLSQGMSSVLGWIGVLLQRLYEVNPARPSPKDAPVLVLVDEIDAHLHPSWQRQLLRLLAKTFGGMQLIGTTHSPLIVGNAEPGELVQLTHRDAIPVQSSLKGMRADQILTSEAFDLSSTRDTETADAIDDYRRLLRQPQTPVVKADAKGRLTELLNRLPEPEDTPEERKAAELVSRWLHERAIDELMALPEDRQLLVEAEMRAIAARLAKETAL
jgi:hypothetical protein